jgi:RNA polymerase sigma factor (sigma-70 family)
LEGAGRFEYRGEAAFRNWLYQTALRKLVDHLRYHRAQKRDAAAIADPLLNEAECAVLASSFRSPSEDAMVREETAALARGFARLEESDRRIIRLVYIDGLSHAQASEQLACTEVASRKQLSRALARLSRLIG